MVKKMLPSIDNLYQSLSLSIYLDVFYGGLFSLKRCLLSVLINLYVIFMHVLLSVYYRL